MPDPLYIAARRVLLDGLEALGPHRKSVILAGAQAVYLHTGEGDLAVAPFTTDGDLVIDPGRLARQPLLADVLEAAGFAADAQPGRWLREGVPIDFLVPQAVGGRRGRGAELGSHGARFARQARGLEGVIVDSSVKRLAALEEGDTRAFDISVAGPSALLVSKLIKLGERLGTRERDKDALDLFRLLRAVPTGTLVDGFRRLAGSDVARSVADEALGLLSEHFSTGAAAGNDMLVGATEGLEDEAQLRASCAALTKDLLKGLQRHGSGATPGRDA